MAKYPQNRKRKIGHEQYFDFQRSINFGGRIEVFYILYIKNHWWACKKGRQHGSFGAFRYGSFFAQIVKINFFLGFDGQRVLGYINKTEIIHYTIASYKFVFVRDVLQAGYLLQKTFSGRRSNRKAGRPSPPEGFKYPFKTNKFALNKSTIKEDKRIVLPYKKKQKLKQVKVGYRWLSPKKHEKNS